MNEGLAVPSDPPGRRRALRCRTLRAGYSFVEVPAAVHSCPKQLMTLGDPTVSSAGESPGLPAPNRKAYDRFMAVRSRRRTSALGREQPFKARIHLTLPVRWSTNYYTQKEWGAGLIGTTPTPSFHYSPTQFSLHATRLSSLTSPPLCGPPGLPTRRDSVRQPFSHPLAGCPAPWSSGSHLTAVPTGTERHRRVPWTVTPPLKQKRDPCARWRH